MTRKPRQRLNLSQHCDEREKKPKNPRHLPIALEFLKPFRFRTEAAAIDAGLNVMRNKKRLGVSEELARRLIEHAARTFNESRFLEAKAPRLKDLTSELEWLMDTISQLQTRMEQLSYFALGTLRNIPPFDERMSQLAIAADIESLPKPTSAKRALWLRRLAGLRQLVEVKLKNLAADPGGNTNLRRQIYGSAKWGLVYDAFDIYDLFKPYKATQTPGGSFEQFLFSIFEYATARSGEHEAKFDLKIVKALRTDRKLEIEEDQLSDEELNLFPQDAERTAAANARLSQIFERRREIFALRTPLWKKTWPHFRIG